MLRMVFITLMARTIRASSCAPYGESTRPLTCCDPAGVTELLADQGGLKRDSVSRRPPFALRRLDTILAEVGEQASCGRPPSRFSASHWLLASKVVRNSTLPADKVATGIPSR
jgi:hypothetical protein